MHRADPTQPGLPPIGVALLTLMLILSASAPAFGERSLYLNGVLINGVTSQTFSNAKVRIDSLGNVHISAKGYDIQRVEETPGADNGSPSPKAAAAPANAKATRYWLKSTKTLPGSTRFDVQVYLNGRLIRVVRSSDAPLLYEVTQHLKVGKNILYLKATKNVSQPLTNSKDDDQFQLSLERGKLSQGRVVLEKRIVSYTRLARDSGSHADELPFTVE